MPDKSSPLRFLGGRQNVALSCLFAVQIAVFYGLPKERPVDLKQPLASLPASMGAWTMTGEAPLDQHVQDVLKADDTITRSYQEAGVPSGPGRTAGLYVAFFRSQTTGVSPHSPKNCLPGSGWAVLKSDMIDVEIPGLPHPVRINRYIVTKGEAKSLALYWYQSHNRVVASEYLAKIYLVLDSIRYRRSDTSLVRVLVAYSSGGEDRAQATAVSFIQSGFGAVNALLPQ